jgi:hypothetical protein
LWLEFLGSHAQKGITLSELRNRMIRDMRLAGLVEETQREYLRAVRQLAHLEISASSRGARPCFSVVATLWAKKCSGILSTDSW